MLKHKSHEQEIDGNRDAIDGDRCPLFGETDGNEKVEEYGLQKVIAEMSATEAESVFDTCFFAKSEIRC